MGQQELGDGAQTPTTAASHTRLERPLAVDESHRRVEVLLACLDRLRELIAFLVFI